MQNEIWNKPWVSVRIFCYADHDVVYFPLLLPLTLSLMAFFLFYLLSNTFYLVSSSPFAILSNNLHPVKVFECIVLGLRYGIADCAQIDYKYLSLSGTRIRVRKSNDFRTQHRFKWFSLTDQGNRSFSIIWLVHSTHGGARFSRIDNFCFKQLFLYVAFHSINGVCPLNHNTTS